VELMHSKGSIYPLPSEDILNMFPEATSLTTPP
jgi:hypothetical protein